MRIYTVHLRMASREPDRDAVLVKEGFSWPAFFFTVIWALFTRQWLVAVILFGAGVVYSLILATLGFDPVATVAGGVLFNIGVGLLGNDLRRWSLAVRGYREAGVVAGDGLLAAERRWFAQGAA